MGLFSINAKPGRMVSALLSCVLFAACLAAYSITAQVRHKENPQDKVVPTLSEMADGFSRTAFEPDRKGEYRLLIDTMASGRRFLISVGLAYFAIILGLFMGVMPYFETIFYRFVLFFDKIPALALLPILFIVFGLGETSKLALIAIGVYPTLILDTYLRAKAVPREQLVKGRTLGASDFETAFHIVFPQIFPEVLDTLRLNLKTIILFLIAGESLAATAGLGYRIFVVRRYIAMDIIIPYVIWMSLLALLADFVFRFWIKMRYRWAV